MKNYTVFVDRVSLEPGHVGEFRARLFTSHHATPGAARRKLGSLISGKLKALTSGPVHVFAIDNASLEKLAYVDLARLEAAAPRAPRASLVERIKVWALANYSKNYGASCLVETFTDEELAAEFKSLADAKAYARLMGEQFRNAQDY